MSKCCLGLQRSKAREALEGAGLKRLTRPSAIKHFAGSRDCGITQADIYLAPWPTNPKVSPFCKDRARLLEALSGGGRHGWDEPFVGKGK